MLRLSGRLAVLLCALPVAVTHAVAARASPATDWLLDQARTDGAYHSAQPLATPVQATSEALAALRARGVADPTVAAARAYVSARPALTTEVIARGIRQAVAVGDDPSDLVDTLRTHRNRDGGFGDRVGHTSTALDTAWALAALAAAGRLSGDAAGGAVAFLRARQGAGGAWSDGGGPLLTTAVALDALHRARATHAVAGALDAGRDFLLSQRAADGAIGSSHETAAALLAIAATAPSKDVYANVVTSLRARQQSNGSWGGSVFATALAVQALALVERPQPNPDLGSLALRLVDAETEVALAGVPVTLSGADTRAAETDADGAVRFDHLPAGDYAVAVTADGFPPLATAAAIEGGRHTDLGVLELLRSTDPGIAHLTGIVAAVADGTPVAGARITVTGAASAATVSDDNGNFTLTGLEPGTVRIEASAAGFQTASAELAIAGGETTHVGLVLHEVASTTFALFGQVTAGATGEPLAGAAITLAGATRADATTDSEGRYRLSGLAPGDVTLAATADGFGEVATQLSAEAGTEYRFSPALPPDGSVGAGDATTLTGTVVDAVTGQPVGNAMVEVATASGIWSVRTDSLGAFRIDGVSGDSGQLSIAATGYDPATFTLPLAAGLSIDLGRVTLTPTGDAARIGITKRVLDAETDEPIAGARVESVYAGLNDVTSTAADGSFTIDVLAAEAGRLRISADGYEPADIPVYFVSPDDPTKTGDFYLRPLGLVTLQPDLALAGVDVTGAATDPDAFMYQGAVSVALINVGGAAVSDPFRVTAIRGEDQLGSKVVDAELAARGGVATVVVPLAGTVAFRDAPFRIVVDSDSAIPESDEQNNELAVQDRCRSDPTGCPPAPPADLTGWTDVQLAGTHNGFARWDLFDGNTRARLRGNFNPKLLISDFEFADSTMVGTLRTRGFDDDWMGFVWGYQDDRHFYRFRWRQNAPRLMQVHRVDSSEPLFNDTGTDDVLLFETLEGWERNVTYRYVLRFGDGRSKITVTRGEEVIESILVLDDQYTGGRFGFYNYSQGTTSYRAFPVQGSVGIDLTVGRLEVVDRGIGSPPALRARVGNAGARVSPAGATARFYSGDPGAGGTLLATRELPGIASDDFLDIETGPVDGVTGQEDLFVVVDADGEVTELRENNNSDRASPVPASVLGSVSVATDAAAYIPGASARISAHAENRGTFPGPFSIALRIEDAAGDVVAHLGEHALGVLASGEGSGVTADWSTRGIVAGSYRAVATLRAGDGSVADEAAVALELRPSAVGDPVATLATTTRAAVYERSDTVVIDHLVRNRSPNAVLTGATLTTRLRDSANREYWRGEIGLGDLAPGAQRARVLTAVLTDAPEGEWRVESLLAAADGTVLASAASGFRVVAGLLDTLSGTVSVAHPERDIGEPQGCTDTLTQRGDAVTVRIRRLVLDRTRAVAVEAGEEIIPFVAGETRVLGRAIATAGLEPGAYTCALQVWSDGAWVTLDAADFRLVRPPIDIEATLESGARGRLLVLLDPPDARVPKQEDPHGPAGSPGPAAQRAWLEQRLDAAGWSYTIVTDAPAFAAELRSDGYAVIALLNEKVGIAEAVQDELVDAVHDDGIGLVVAGMHDRRNGRVERALGARSMGRLPHARGLRLFDSELALASELDFALDTKPLWLDPRGAYTAGFYRVRPDVAVPGKGKAGLAGGGARPIALTTHAHGRGRSVGAGFDLLLHGTATGGDNGYGDLLLAALAHAHPATVVPVAGRVLPLAVTLVNEGIATPGRVLLAVPAGVEVVDAGSGTVADGVIAWPFTLGLDGQRRLDVWVRLPDAADRVTFTATVQTGTGPDWRDHRTVTHAVPIEPAP